MIQFPMLFALNMIQAGITVLLGACSGTGDGAQIPRMWGHIKQNTLFPQIFGQVNLGFPLIWVAGREGARNNCAERAARRASVRAWRRPVCVAMPSSCVCRCDCSAYADAALLAPGGLRRTDRRGVGRRRAGGRATTSRVPAARRRAARRQRRTPASRRGVVRGSKLSGILHGCKKKVTLFCYSFRSPAFGASESRFHVFQVRAFFSALWESWPAECFSIVFCRSKPPAERRFLVFLGSASQPASQPET